MKAGQREVRPGQSPICLSQLDVRGLLGKFERFGCSYAIVTLVLHGVTAPAPALLSEVASLLERAVPARRGQFCLKNWCDGTCSAFRPNRSSRRREPSSITFSGDAPRGSWIQRLPRGRRKAERMVTSFIRFVRLDARMEAMMLTLLILVLLVLILFGGGGYYGYRRDYYGGGGAGLVGLIIVILLLIVIFGGPGWGWYHY